MQQVLDYLIVKLAVADAGVIWGYEPSTGRLVALASSGIDTNLVRQVRLHTDRDVISRVFQNSKSEAFTVDQAAVTDTGNIEKILGVKIPSLAYPAAIACIPLNSNSTRYGILLFLKTGHRAAFTSKENIFFQIIGYLLTLFMKMDALGKTAIEMEVVGSNEKYRAGIVSNMAHEMRTPLTSIKGFSTALLLKEIVYSPDKQREFLEIIDRECDLLEDLISDHLESSIIEAGMMKIDLQPVRLPRLAEKASDDMGRRYPKHSLLVDFADDFPLIDANPERILQVLRQLLDNAAKYSPGGGWIVLQGTISEDQAIISVSDEGVGIAPEDLNHLFDRFFRAGTNSGAQIMGTGLGLPISRAIIEAHGGRIWAESQLGHGSKFCFSLPLKGLSQNPAE